MSDYLDRLERLDAAGCLCAPAATRLLLLTGQSDFAGSALSPQQTEFLDTVAPPACAVLHAGFPFHRSFLESPYRDAAMAAAAFRNARQFGWTLYSPRFRHIVAQRLQSAIAATTRRLILITGSCGLQLANAAWPALRLPDSVRLTVIALGPACFAPLRMPATIIQGRRDRWSRLFYRGPVDHHCDCGHLDYYASEDVAARVRERLQ